MAIIIILLFLFYQFFVKPKLYRVQKQEDTSGGKDTFFRRIARGFGVMREKIANSEYAKRLEEEHKTASATDMMPSEMLQEDKKEEGPDPFATDFSRLTKVDF